MITYDIKDLYVNIPIEETLTITKQQLLINNDIHKTEQIITCLRTILNQNYFEFQNNIYHPKKHHIEGILTLNFNSPSN